MTSELEVGPALSTRLTRVHPAGGVTVAVLGCTPMAATMKSPLTVVASRGTRSAGRKASMCALPTSALPPATAVEAVSAGTAPAAATTP